MNKDIYMRVGVVKACDLKYHRGDSDHIVYDAGLKGNAMLHRFDNRATEPYSAIYDGELTELMSCERSRENAMVLKYQTYYDELYKS